MPIETALREQEERVDVLIKAASRYVTALKGWKKACQTGHIANLVKSSAAAGEIALQLHTPAEEAVAAWSFDVRAYLESPEWREELLQACAAQGIRVLEEEGMLVSPPVLVRAQPAQNRLAIGKVNWPTLHPAPTAAYLKKLKEKSSSATVLQNFLNSLYEASKKVSRQGDSYALFRDIYALFSYAPGWAKENSRATFAQQIYALERSDVSIVKDGKKYEIDYPTGTPKTEDVFSVISDDGRPIRYYGIWFR